MLSYKRKLDLIINLIKEFYKVSFGWNGYYHFQEKRALGWEATKYWYSYPPLFILFKTTTEYFYTLNPLGTGDPNNRGESKAVALVGLSSFDPNPSANLVSVGREGD